MTYEYLKNLKKHNRTLKLLNSDNFAMSVAFFYFVFVEKKYITITHREILTLLDDFLYNLNQIYGNIYPKTPKEYLDDFASDKSAYLKKYYGSDGELLYELTPYSQKALEIVESLERKEFVGSRSKFNAIFELLEELIFETNYSDKERVAKLKEQKAKIDKQIEAIEAKEDIRFDSSRVKEHFMLIEEQSRKLKYDFAQIEYNFRDLNASAMEQIATTNESKDGVLSSIFDIEDSIRQSDQGKSFFAFWQILTDAQKSEQLSQMLEQLYNLKEVQEVDKDGSLKHLKFDLLNNANKIAKVTARLMEQLRRFIDDKVWVENRKILELCKEIEQKAIEIKNNPPKQRNFIAIDGVKVSIDSVFEKSLYTPKERVEFKAEVKEEELSLDLDSFYDIFYVDEEALKQSINTLLQIKPQCTLKEVTDRFPVEKGVAELVSYLSIAKNSDNAFLLEDEKERLTIKDSDGEEKVVLVPKVVWTKESYE